jgi:hypothetical protein
VEWLKVKALSSSPSTGKKKKKKKCHFFFPPFAAWENRFFWGGSLIPMGGGGRWGKGVGGRIWCKYCVHVSVNGEMRPVETIPRVGEGR